MSARPKVGLLDLAEPATVTQVDDRILVDRILAGDRDAYRLLVEREATTVFRCCYRVLGHVQDAEDVAQDTFVTAYRALATWRGDGSLHAWLAQIATRNAIRQAGRRVPAASLDLGMDWTGLVDRIGGSDGTDPAATAGAAESAKMIRDAVRVLPEPYRETIALRYFAELSIEEIARSLDRPVGTVKVHVHRGLERLRIALAEESVA